MSTQITTPETVVAAKPTKKAPAKKKAVPKKKAAPKKKGTKKTTAKKSAKAKPTKKAKAAKPSTPAEFGVDRSHDLPWGDKKIAVFRALKALKATNGSSARTAKEVADKADVTARDVRHYCYHGKAAGLAQVVDTEEGRGYGFHITAKGLKALADKPWEE